MAPKLCEAERANFIVSEKKHITAYIFIIALRPQGCILTADSLRGGGARWAHGVVFA